MEIDPSLNRNMDIAIVPLHHPEQPPTTEEQRKIEDRLLKQILTSGKLPENLTFRCIYFKPGHLVIRSSHQEVADWVKDVVGKSKLISHPLKMLTNIETENCYHAFYHAIRSGSVGLLDTLIDNWPNKYFAQHSSELDEILSQTYEELKLKNVPLSGKMEIFVESKLISLRFFSDANAQDLKADPTSIRQRIDLVVQNVNLLKSEHSNAEKVNEAFLFVAKCIAQNIHILKRQLRSTYDTLPWEEMEFCLVIFISSHIKRKEVNLFFNAILSKSKLLNQLESFADKLKDVKNLVENENADTFSALPKLSRERVVAAIIEKDPKFKELYSDFQQISDIVSLEKICDCIKLAFSADPKQREGQIIITRALQVIGENLKNTLESPKLSSTSSELILLSLPINTRGVLIDLRNSPSHSDSLSKRTNIQENADVDFFIAVQNDTRVVGNVVNDILFNNKTKIIKLMLEKINSEDNPDVVKEIIFGLFNKVKSGIMILEGSHVMGPDTLDHLIQELGSNVRNKTDFEKEIFEWVYKVILVAKTKSKGFKNDFLTSFLSLVSVGVGLTKDGNIDDDFIAGIKVLVNLTINDMPSQVESDDLKLIAKLSLLILNSARSRMEDARDMNEIYRITCQIFYIAELEVNDFTWIEEMKSQLYVRSSFIPIQKQMEAFPKEDKTNSPLEVKLSQLSKILKDNSISGEITVNLDSYKENEKLQAVVELLVLDVLSILDEENRLENNLFFLDEKSPVFTGKSLLHYLAHDDISLDVLASDPSMAVVLNAKKLVSENVVESKRKIGKFIKDDPSKLKDKYDQNLATIINKGKMFTTLEEGNFEVFKSYLRKGADIKARNVNSCTALHFAARSPNVEVIKFLTDEKVDVNVKDENGKSPLDVSAAHGREKIVEFFIKENSVRVDDKDDWGKTALHIAAKSGHKHVVEVLLRNNANSNLKDKSGLSPLHLAMKHNRVDVAKILLQNEATVDSNEIEGGYTSLHIAAEFGHLELVEFLLENGASINATNDREGIPLLSAALNGHLEIVKALILKGADVNARVLNGTSPLHYAVEKGHEEMAIVLLKHGADVNIVDKTYGNSPLHYAAKDGNEKIVKALLAKKANARLATLAGATPLHLAADCGHLKIVAALLEHGASSRHKDLTDSSPLHYSCAFGHGQVAELLIKHGADVNDKNSLGQTPLHQAAFNAHKAVVELLIRNKADIRARDSKGNTPLHTAAKNGSTEIIEFLLQNGAEIEAVTDSGTTALHSACLKGNKDAAAFLIKRGANVSATAIFDITPLHQAIAGDDDAIVQLLIENEAQVNINEEAAAPLLTAIKYDRKEIVRILVANGAKLKTKDVNNSPLLWAIKFNNKDIVEVLIENGANVNVDSPLCLAVILGFKGIVEVLLKHNAYTNLKGPESLTPLHLAAKKGHTEIVNVLIAKGASVNAMTNDTATPLHLAAEGGHVDVVEILIANKANVNATTSDGSPLHMASARGHANVVNVLLREGAKIDAKDSKNREALELALANEHFQVVKILLEHKSVDMHAVADGGWTMLHIASKDKNVKMIKYLVEKGCNIFAENSDGSKPIHIAAREGCKDAVEFFLSKGLSINEPGANNQTVLHYAAMKDHVEVVKYSIKQGADVNVADSNGLTPVHIAASNGCKNVLDLLLNSAAVYNTVDNCGKKPVELANDESVINLLATTEKLFHAVKRNNGRAVMNYIKSGASINGKNISGGAALHFAAWKGFEEIVMILLLNKADPNVVGNKGFYPIHYAAKYSHFKIVQRLLAHGAMFDAAADCGKTPADLAVAQNIANLLKLISDAFKKVKEGNTQVISDLKEIKDIATVRAVMSARNTENKSLIVVALNSSFSEVEKLKTIFQTEEMSLQIAAGSLFFNEGNYAEACRLFQIALESRKAILGPDNPGTLDIQTRVADSKYNQLLYPEALSIFEEIREKREEMLGPNHQDTLQTRSMIALVTFRQGKHDESLAIFEDVYQRQKESLGPDHYDTVTNNFHKALVLDAQGKFDEALKINWEVFESRKKTLGENDLTTVIAKNNIAKILHAQGKLVESLKMYQEVLEKKKRSLGANHSNTLRTLFNIAQVFASLENLPEALKTFKEILSIQKQVLPLNHSDTFTTQQQIGHVLCQQGKFIGAYKAYSECINPMMAQLGRNHPLVLETLQKLQVINMKFLMEGTNAADFAKHLQKDLNNAASLGERKKLERLIETGADVNEKDVEGRTALHFAAGNGHIEIVRFLLKNDADVHLVTNKGNTPLHSATSKGYKEIVEVLCQHVTPGILSEFVNAETFTAGTTALHVAAKFGSMEVVKSLLKYGAIYNISNKDGKTPVNVSSDRKVIVFLNLIGQLFKDVKMGNVECINKLKARKPDEVLAISNARNNQGNTLLKEAAANKHTDLAGKLLEMLKQ